MDSGGITRRRAVALGVASGAASVIPWTQTGFAASSSADPFRIELSSDALTGGVVRSPRRFELLGIRGVGIEAARPRVRTRRRGGAWGPWLAIAASGHGPDSAARLQASEPVWTGPADELQLRLDGSRARGRWELVVVPEQRVPAVARAAQVVEGAPAVVMRAQWGAAAVRPRSEATYGDVRMAFVHHTVNANNYSPADAPGIVLAIAKYHRNSNGWSDIGYNFVVDRFGTIYEGRAGGIDQAVVGAQAGGWNSISTGVAIIGTFDALQAPAPAIDAVCRLLAWKLPLHAAPVIGEFGVTSSGGSANRYRAGTAVKFQRISGHRDGCSTSCPGNSLYAQLETIRTKTLALAGPGGIAPEGRPVVTLSAPPSDASYGSELMVEGTVTSADKAPLAGTAVAVQKRGSKGWVTVARGTTDSAGRFFVPVSWKRGGALRAAVSDAQGVVASPSANVLCTPEITAASKSARVRFGRKAVVTGKATPATNARLIVERQGKDGKYRQIASVPVKPGKDGSYRATARLTRPALHRMRVKSAAHDGVAAGGSPRLFVRAVRKL